MKPIRVGFEDTEAKKTDATNTEAEDAGGATKPQENSDDANNEQLSPGETKVAHVEQNEDDGVTRRRSNGK